MANILKPIVKQPEPPDTLYYIVAVQLIQISFSSQSLVLCPVCVELQTIHRFSPRRPLLGRNNLRDGQL